jgi:hypothetical protein
MAVCFGGGGSASAEVVREAETWGGRVGAKRGTGVAKSAQRTGLDMAAERTFSARHQSLAVAKQRKRRTLVKFAQPHLEGAPPTVREARMDGAKRELCGLDSSEGVRNPGIALTGLNDDLDGGWLPWVRDAHEVR